MDKKESFYWNLVKGAAIFLMLWGHCIQYCALDDTTFMGNSVFRTIYSFHMPIFMLVSGYLFFFSFQKRNLEELLQHRIQGMLYPIVMATLFNNVLLLIPRYLLTGHVDFLWGTLFWGISESLWFLWSVLYCSLLVGICGKLTEKPYLQLLLIIAAGFVIVLLPQWNYTLFMYPYFVAGFFCGMYRKHARRLYRLVRYAVLVIFPVMMTFFEKKHYIYVTPMYSEELGLAMSAEIALFRWAIGFVGSIWLMSIVEILLRFGERVPVLQSCLRSVSLLGSNSLQIYCLSASLLSGYMPHLYRKFVSLIGGNIYARNLIVFNYIATPIIAALWSVVLYIAVVLLRKWKLHRLIFGR